jgi:SWI2/SNF2 ATPase
MRTFGHQYAGFGAKSPEIVPKRVLLVQMSRMRLNCCRGLIQHSAGSGKSNSIAWLSHQLIGIERNGKEVFDSVIVVTDRRILDHQIQKTIKQFMQVGATVGFRRWGTGSPPVVDLGAQLNPMRRTQVSHGSLSHSLFHYFAG